MRILLTGGAGDLGQVLTPLLAERGDVPVRLDVRPPADGQGEFVAASILDRTALAASMVGVDAVVHIAAWHGIHEALGQKSVTEFWDVNVTGTFNVLEAARQVGIDRIVNISSTSVYDTDQFYGDTKRLAEQVAQIYATRYGMHMISLRPRAFIPYWNQAVYADYVAWARWFWGGAVHIDDVAQAVVQSLDVLGRGDGVGHVTLDLDSAYEYTRADLDNWDADGPGSTFRRVYRHHVALAQRYGLPMDEKPRPLDISETRRHLGYAPRFSLGTLLAELAQYGEAGPPR